MEKIKFMSEEMNEEVDFYVLEQTKLVVCHIFW